MVHLSRSDLLLAEHWAKWAVWKRSNSSSLSLRVGDGWPQNGLWGLSVTVWGLRLMKYFLSGLIPHLTFLIFDLLMVIAHYAGFKGQINKKVLSLLIEPFSRNLVQISVISQGDKCLILTRSTQVWWPIPKGSFVFLDFEEDIPSRVLIEKRK